jgi:hypothetical protein
MVISLQDRRENRQPLPPLGKTDWTIVETARTDGSLSLYPEGIRARLARALFNIPVPHSLANKRLEALRRFAVRAWHWDVIRQKHQRAFLDAGFSRIHVLEILSHVGMKRGFTPSIEYETMPSSPRRGAVHCRCG